MTMYPPHEIRCEINQVPFGVYLTVTQDRVWAETGTPGNRVPRPYGPPKIELMAGDWPEFLSVGEAIKLRDALSEAIQVAGEICK